MLPYIPKQVVQERVEFEHFINAVVSITGLTLADAEEFAKAITPVYFEEAQRALGEEMDVEKVRRIFTDASLVAYWRLGYAGREFVRGVIDAPPLSGPVW